MFASAVANDQPTIDVMNEVGMDASAVGNHEFDKGWPDLRDRVIGPTATPNAHWAYLGANVYKKGTQTPALPEYATYTIDGVRVGVIGAVTQETPTLVSPGGITDLDFGDPIAAVNRVAGQLSDGNTANGEADVLVATFHAGSDVTTSYPDAVGERRRGVRQHGQPGSAHRRHLQRAHAPEVRRSTSPSPAATGRPGRWCRPASTARTSARSCSPTTPRPAR